MIPQNYNSYEEYINKLSLLDKNIYDSVLIGSHREILFEITGGEISILGVDFIPGGAAALLGIEENKLSGNVISISETNNSIELQAMESIVFEKSDAFMMLDLYFEKKLLKHNTAAKFNILKNTITEMDIYKPDFSIRRFCSGNITQEKNIYRMFTSNIGISPNQFVAIQKFRKAIELMIFDPKLNIFHIAALCGFYDISHLNKYFKMVCGQIASYVYNNIKEYKHQGFAAKHTYNSIIMALFE